MCSYRIGAVEFSERMCVLSEMRRHPIHDHADAGLMTFVDEMTKFIRRAEPARRRVIICDLITPGTFEGMLGELATLRYACNPSPTRTAATSRRARDN
jgi:hypothetical protein